MPKPKPAAPTPTFFRSPAELRRWLAEHHASETECWIGLVRAGADRQGVTYAQALDEALCFGWIDAVRKSIDDETWTIRFTPRKPKSYWSSVNLKHFARLEAAGRIEAPGRKVFEARASDDERKYSFEQGTVALEPKHEAALRKNRKAFAFFEALPPSVKKPTIWWVVSAKQEATRERRLAELIARSEQGLRIKHLMRPTKKA